MLKTSEISHKGGAAALLVAGIGLLVSGCDANHGLSVGGDTPYVRCLAAAPPASGRRKLGPLTLTIRDRVADITGLPSGATLATFAGPGFGRPPTTADLAGVRAAHPDLVLLLGDLGDTQAIADATALSMAGLGRPVLVVAGGRDTRERIKIAIDRIGAPAGYVLDVSGLRSIRIERDTFFPVAGAADGHDALTADGCGYAEEDLRELAKGARSVAGRKWLLAWQAPAKRGRSGLASTEQGIDLGSVALARLGEAIGASGGIYAWPHVQAFRPMRAPGSKQSAPAGMNLIAGLVVPRLIGPSLERSDGSRVPAGFALLRLRGDGLQILNMPDMHGYIHE